MVNIFQFRCVHFADLKDHKIEGESDMWEMWDNMFAHVGCPQKIVMQ